MRISAYITRTLAAIGASTVLLIVLGSVGLLFAGKWLRAEDAPKRADAIVVLAGAPERTVYAAELVLRGYAPVVYVSRPARERGHKLLEQYGVMLPPEEEVNRIILLKKGVSDRHIQMFGVAALNTWDEARGARTEFPASIKTIMVVTSPAHVLRAKMIFNDVFAGTDKRILVVANPYEPFPDHWWGDQDAARQVAQEMTKVVFYKLGGNYSRSKSAN